MINHFYIFTLGKNDKNIPNYICTAGTEKAAKSTVEALSKKKDILSAFYTTNHVPTKFWY